MVPLQFEFSLIRYMPHPAKGEFLNIGVVLRESTPPDGSSARSEVRFTRDWSRVRCLYEHADTERLEKMEQEILDKIRAGASLEDPKGMMDLLENSFSTELQMTETKARYAESMAVAMEQLMLTLVESAKVPRVRTRSGRAAIYEGMRTEFERAGVWGLMRKRVPVALYTRAGDPLKIDCGYRVGGPSADQIVRMFQAVSLKGDMEAAKGLAFSAPQLHEGLERVERSRLELTAVVEPLGDEDEERYRFGAETMERQAIRVVTVNDLGGAAETAKMEMGV